MNAVTIRPGTPKDAESAAKLFQAHLNWINVWHKPDEVVQRDYAVERVRMLLNGNYPSAVAHLEETIIGFAVTSQRDPYVLELANVYVDDPFRHQRVGTQLIQLIESQSIEWGAKTVIATASSNYFPDKALPENFFARLGYEISDLATDTQIYVKKLIQEPAPTLEDRKLSFTRVFSKQTPIYKDLPHKAGH